MEVYVMAIGGGKTLTIYLAADLKKFNQGTAQAQTGLKGLAGTMKNLLGPAAIGAGIAIAGLATKIAVDSIGAASDLVETQNKVIEIFGESSDAILAFADNSAVALGQTKQEALDGAATFALFGQSAGLSGEALVGFSSQLVGLSADLASFNNSSPQEAITAIGAALRGEAEPLRRFGVLLDDATLKARAMEMGIYNGTGSLTQQQKVLAAHSEILAQTTTQQGDFARTSDGLANSQRILQAAVDNLTTAFGTGLLTGFEKAAGGATDLAEKLKDLEDDAEKAGATLAVIGTTALDVGANFLTAYSGVLQFVKGMQDSENAFVRVLGYANPLTGVALALGDSFEDLAKSEDAAAKATDKAAAAAANAVPAFDALYGATNKATSAHMSYLQAHGVKTTIIKKANEKYQDLAARLNQVNTFASITDNELKELNETLLAGSSATEKLTKREKELIDLHETKSAVFASNRKELAFYTGELQKATDAIDSFTTNMQANLLAGIDLGSVYKGQFNEEGEKTGESLLAGFNKQIEQATWFGNVLDAIKSQNADIRLIEEIAGLGPEIGGALGQQMLDEGLVPTLNEKFIGVQEATKKRAMGLVPEFLLAGQESALTMVDSISEQMAKEVNRLAKIGKKIAKPLGQSFKAELMSDVAAALREVEAAGAAGRAEVVAAAERRQVNLTNAAVAQALQNLVRSADARNGAPVSPVNR
jgi:hypothetical protein